MKLRVQSPDELVAAVDHLMGFHVEDSITVIPVGSGLPAARVDLPKDQTERSEMVQALLGAYGRGEGGDVVVIGFADSPTQVEATSRQMREAFAEVGVEVCVRLWAGDQRWADLDSGVSGVRSVEAAGRIAAEMVASGRRAPATSRAAVDRAFIGDPEPVTRYLHAVAGDMENSTPARERQWAVGRGEAFVDDGRTLTDPQAARMLACVQSVATRDQLASRITTETASSWGPLWDDLTRRSPEELVAPVATLSAISSWCQGNGARAWAALERIPAEDRASYPLAMIVASTLQAGIAPHEWDRVRSAALDALPTETAGNPGTSMEAAESRLRQRTSPPSSGEHRPPTGPTP